MSDPLPPQTSANRPTPQPAEAIQITAPPGGWDRVTQSAQGKHRAAGPVSTGAFESGKL